MAHPTWNELIGVSGGVLAIMMVVGKLMTNQAISQAESAVSEKLKEAEKLVNHAREIVPEGAILAWVPPAADSPPPKGWSICNGPKGLGPNDGYVLRSGGVPGRTGGSDQLPIKNDPVMVRRGNPNVFDRSVLWWQTGKSEDHVPRHYSVVFLCRERVDGRVSARL